MTEIDMPKVSVIVPVYNVEKYLHSCLDSILNQTFTDYELLLVDDGSTDSSGQICEEYAKKNERVRVFHKPNEGLSSARNVGMCNAKGWFLMFVDSDDYILVSDGFKEIVDYAEKLSLDVVRFEYVAVNESYECLHDGGTSLKQECVGKSLSAYDMVTKAINGEWFSCLFLLRRVILGGTQFDVNRKFQEDIDFGIHLFSKPSLRCGYWPGKIYAYRQREGSITRTLKVQNLEGSFSLCEVFAQSAKSVSDQLMSKFFWWNSVMMYYWTMNTLSEDPYYSQRMQIILKLRLNDLYHATLCRLKQSRVKIKYLTFILAPPKTSLFLLRWKNRLVHRVKSCKKKSCSLKVD